MTPGNSDPADSAVLTALLACPDCRAPLDWRGGRLDPCPGCGRVFEMAGRIPLLHPSADRPAEEAGRRFFIEEPGRLAQLRARHPRLARLLALPDFTSPKQDPWLSRKAKADYVVASCSILARK